jgi:hypothetical protein
VQCEITYVGDIGGYQEYPGNNGIAIGVGSANDIYAGAASAFHGISVIKPSLREDTLYAQKVRNLINDRWIEKNIPNPLNVTAKDLKDAKFGDPELPKHSKFHNHWFGFKGNTKYVHPKGYEIVVDKSGKLVTDAKVMGTYNYGKGPLFHSALDVIPYLFVGNSAEDTTTVGQRVNKMFPWVK